MENEEGKYCHFLFKTQTRRCDKCDEEVTTTCINSLQQGKGSGGVRVNCVRITVSPVTRITSNTS